VECACTPLHAHAVQVARDQTLRWRDPVATDGNPIRRRYWRPLQHAVFMKLLRPQQSRHLWLSGGGGSSVHLKGTQIVMRVFARASLPMLSSLAVQ
jgi:hypothetical protein